MRRLYVGLLSAVLAVWYVCRAWLPEYEEVEPDWRDAQ